MVCAFLVFAAFPVIGVLNGGHVVLTALHVWLIGRINPSVKRSSPKALLCYALTVIVTTPLGIAATAMFVSSPPRALAALAIGLCVSYAVVAPALLGGGRDRIP